jgi:hypothetical protein
MLQHTCTTSIMIGLMLCRHPWFDVTMANWRKYPNVRRPDLVSVDILDKHIDDNGVLHIKRLLIVEGLGYPEWLKKVRVANDCIQVRESDFGHQRRLFC